MFACVRLDSFEVDESRNQVATSQQRWLLNVRSSTKAQLFLFVCDFIGVSAGASDKLGAWAERPVNESDRSRFCGVFIVWREVQAAIIANYARNATGRIPGLPMINRQVGRVGPVPILKSDPRRNRSGWLN